MQLLIQSPLRNGGGKCIFGHLRTPREVDEFSHEVTGALLFAIIMVSPSEITPPEIYGSFARTQCCWGESSVSGGVIGGAWSVRTHLHRRSDNLRPPHHHPPFGAWAEGNDRGRFHHVSIRYGRISAMREENITDREFVISYGFNSESQKAGKTGA